MGTKISGKTAQQIDLKMSFCCANQGPADYVAQPKKQTFTVYNLRYFKIMGCIYLPDLQLGA